MTLGLRRDIFIKHEIQLIKIHKCNYINIKTFQKNEEAKAIKVAFVNSTASKCTTSMWPKAYNVKDI